jgi:hypothetical protein
MNPLVKYDLKFVFYYPLSAPLISTGVTSKARWL